MDEFGGTSLRRLRVVIIKYTTESSIDAISRDVSLVIGPTNVFNPMWRTLARGITTPNFVCKDTSGDFFQMDSLASTTG